MNKVDDEARVLVAAVFAADEFCPRCGYLYHLYASDRRCELLERKGDAFDPKQCPGYAEPDL